MRTQNQRFCRWGRSSSPSGLCSVWRIPSALWTEISRSDLSSDPLADLGIANRRIYEPLGIDRRDFAKLVKKPEWQDWVAAMGLAPRPLKGNVVGLRVVG
jgi:hypothetical protein